MFVSNLPKVTLLDGTERVVALKDGKPVSIAQNVFRGLKGDPGTNAMGLPGIAGVSVDFVEKTATAGLVDTYTITYTDQSTSTFTVTNGADGEDGADSVVPGPPGADGADGGSGAVNIYLQQAYGGF